MVSFREYKTLKELIQANITIKKFMKRNWITYLIFQKVPSTDFYKGASPTTKKELKGYISKIKKDSDINRKSQHKLKGFQGSLPTHYHNVYKGWARAWIGPTKKIIALYGGKELKNALNQMGIKDNEIIGGLIMLYPENIKMGWGIGGFVFDYMLKDLQKYKIKYVFAFAAHDPIIPLLKTRGFKQMIISEYITWKGVKSKRNIRLDHWIKKLR